jgi:4-hydroxybenzoate polyprenyltransferase
MAAYSTQLPMKNLTIQALMFAIGSILLHSAACVLNDICDRDFDRKVGKSHLSSDAFN